MIRTLDEIVAYQGWIPMKFVAAYLGDTEESLRTRLHRIDRNGLVKDHPDILKLQVGESEKAVRWYLKEGAFTWLTHKYERFPGL